MSSTRTDRESKPSPGAQVCLQDLNGLCGLAGIRQGFGVTMVDEIGAQNEKLSNGTIL